MRMKFYIQGPRKQGTVNLEMREVSLTLLHLIFSFYECKIKIEYV